MDALMFFRTVQQRAEVIDASVETDGEGKLVLIWHRKSKQSYPTDELYFAAVEEFLKRLTVSPQQEMFLAHITVFRQSLKDVFDGLYQQYQGTQLLTALRDALSLLIFIVDALARTTSKPPHPAG